MTGDVPSEAEVLVIGAGPGGYVAAIRAGQLGLDAALVEPEVHGGACLDRGCIPSKALLSAADLAHRAGHAGAMGIHADPEVEMGALVDWKNGVVERLSTGVERLCKANGVDLVSGLAAFIDDSTVRITEDGEDRGTIGFEHAVVATGSRPVALPGFDFGDDPVLDSAAALDLRTVPDQLVVVGAGYIGMELSTAFAKLGADVTVVEMLDRILPGYEADLARVVRDGIEDLGVEINLGESAREWCDASGGITVVTENDEGTDEYPADEVLVAVGREPVTDTADLGAVGLEPDESGFLDTDERGRTDVEGIFAVGDVAGEPMLAHEASLEGEVAAEVIAGNDSTTEGRAVPAAAFTDPEVATVGLTEAAAEEAGFEPAVGEFPFRASGRALTADRGEGFARVVTDAETGTVLGGQVVGPDASELVAEIGLAVETSATLADLAGTVHAHPTLAEAVREAALNAGDRAIHTLNR